MAIVFSLTHIFFLVHLGLFHRYPDAPLMRATAIITPEILHYSNEGIKSWEGCLSVQSLRGLVPRHSYITVRYLDQQGNEQQEVLTGFIARIL